MRSNLCILRFPPSIRWCGFLVVVAAAFATVRAQPVAAQPVAAQPASSPAASSAPDLSRPHPYGVHDSLSMDRLGNPQPSPNGQWIAFTVRSWDARSNKTSSHLWLVSIDGSRLRQLTTAAGQANLSPVWSPDSRTLAFVSTRGGSQQIWTIAIDGGEADLLSDLPVDVDNLRWSPAGQHLAFSAEVYPHEGLAATAAKDKAKSERPTKAMKFERLFVRHWDSWDEGKRSHLFVLPMASTGGRWKATGEPVDVMKGVDADCPVKPFGGAEDYAWSPDGAELAYTAQLGDDIAWSTDLNVFVVPVTGGAARCITADNQATDTGPVYSPDGTTIAFRSMARPGFESDRLQIKLWNRRTGQLRTVAGSWDRSPASLEWRADSRQLYAVAAESARQKIFAIDVASGQTSVIVGDHYNSSAVLAPPLDGSGPGRLIYGQDSLVGPLELWAAALDGSQPQRLTHFNDERTRLAMMSPPEEFHFAGARGEQVQAWILKPVGFTAGKKYPVAFVIHGGPQGAIEDHFHYRWNPQVLAGAGYAVIAVNFHGSTGFGQAFTDSISGDWGGKPFEDLMKGLDYALAHYDWLDANRVGALGASYGGWMINWINGHTKRFKCLVNHDGGFDEYANYFTTEELWFPEWEFKGTPWANPELYEKFSPSRFVQHWQTPTLVIHGAKDYRLVDAEGIATFTALQRRGIPSQLLYFPDENHWVLKPQNSIIWHDTILAWLDRWLRE